MSITEGITGMLHQLEPHAQLSEEKGAYVFVVHVAERKAFLSKKKLVYTARFRIDDPDKTVRFTESLLETGFGLSSGESGISPGLSFSSETSVTSFSSGKRSGTIQEQSTLFGKQYSYTFDYARIRNTIERIAQENGYTFSYQITSRGL